MGDIDIPFGTLSVLNEDGNFCEIGNIKDIPTIKVTSSNYIPKSFEHSKSIEIAIKSIKIPYQSLCCLIGCFKTKENSKIWHRMIYLKNERIRKKCYNKILEMNKNR